MKTKGLEITSIAHDDGADVHKAIAAFINKNQDQVIEEIFQSSSDLGHLITIWSRKDD